MPEKLVTKIHIEKFRHLVDVDLKFGTRLTVIAGSNGTGKTSILGLIGHVFTYKKHKSFFKKNYETEFSNVFRFSETFDRPGEHKYFVEFSDGTKKEALSRQSTEGKKKRFRIDVGSRVKDSGKEEKPVMYLGLKRLIPLAQEIEHSIKLGSEDRLPDDYKIIYNEYYNKIFSTEDKIIPAHTKSTNKENYSPTAETYDAYGISAGQDNVGQIILSLLSFKYLKDTDPDEYNGGLFIVDEIDATLYPAAQKKLLELLLTESKKLMLQVVFTTHSTDILNHILSRKSAHFKHHTEFVYIDNSHGSIKILQGNHYLNQVVADLNHEVFQSIKPEKVQVFFEDEEGCTFFKNLIKGKKLSDKIKVEKVSLGCGNYKNLLRAKFPGLDKALIILDGDFRSQIPETKYQKNVVFLPESVRPENVVYEFLNTLPADDTFWGDAGGYTKRVFIDKSPANFSERTTMKRWFNEQKVNWGVGCAEVFKRWKELNAAKAENFVQDFTKKLGDILD